MSDILKEAQRCLKCKVPFCKKACPVSTDVPTIMKLFLDGHIDECGDILFSNNPLSSICSIICPHEKNCMGNCILGRKGEPVKFYEVEEYISARYLEKAKLVKPEWNGLRIGIIGAGPAGLTLAIIMAKRGYKVTIIDSKDNIGGVLRYGIPEFRLPKSLLDKLLNRMKDLGILFRPNTLIGTALNVDDMFRDGYHAIFIGTGVWKPNALHIEGETLGNVHFATDFLKSPSTYTQLGNHVVIIGAGNVAMDVARSILRTRDCEVDILIRRGEEDITALKEELELARIDGAKLNFNLIAKKIEDDGVIVIPNKKIDKEDGTFEYVLQEDQSYKINCTSVIIAIGQGANSNIVRNNREIDTNNKGLIETTGNGATTREGVYAGGDVVSGAKTVVEAVAATKKVADEIDNYCKNKFLNN